VLLVDDLALAAPRQTDVRRAIERFADEGLRDGDEVLFLTTSGEIRWSARIPEGREDVRALAARIRGRRLGESVSEWMSDWEAFRIHRMESPTGAALEASGISLVPDGPPDGSIPVTLAAGASATERVVGRWLERGVCTPEAVNQCRARVAGRARLVDQVRANRTRDVLSRVDEAVFALSPQRGRKALLLLGEGFLNDPDLDVARVVAGRCREANIAVYFLDAGGLRGAIDDALASGYAGAPNAAEMSLMRQEEIEFPAAGAVVLAEDTGGLALRDTNDLAGAALRVAEESRVYYLLGIAPPPGKGPRDWRRLQVKARRPGVVVRARKGYTLRDAGVVDGAERTALEARRRVLPAGERRETLPLEVARALGSGIDRAEIPLRAMAFAADPRPEGRVRVLVALEADLGRIANLGSEEHPATSLSLSVVATHRDTGDVRRRDEQVRIDAGRGRSLEGWLALVRELDLRPGVSQARVVLRDEFLGRTGAVTVRFVVPPAEGFRLATPVLSDRVVERPGEPPRPVLLARRTFGTRGTLYGQIETFGVPAAPGGPERSVECSWELLRADGIVVRRGPPAAVPPDEVGRRVRLLAAPLDGLPPGDYRLAIRARDAASGATVGHVESLRLE
jgi:VWFA-related protein